MLSSRTVIIYQQTKIVIFSRGKVRRYPKFNFRNSSIDVTDNFTYLDIVFNYNGRFGKAKKHVLNKASRAMFSLKKNLSTVLNLPDDIQLDLFDKLVTPILLYGSEIWSYENNDVIEKLHLRYCRYILNVNKSPTSSMLYGQSGRYSVNIECTSRCILFWARIILGQVSKMSVKIYNLLYKMYNLGIYNSPWLSFVKSTILSAGFGYVWRNQKIPRTLEYLKKSF